MSKPMGDLIDLATHKLSHVSVATLKEEILAQMGPIAEYYRKLREWSGGCALPTEPSKGEVLDFIEAYDKWRDRVK